MEWCAIPPVEEEDADMTGLLQWLVDCNRLEGVLYGIDTGDRRDWDPDRLLKQFIAEMGDYFHSAADVRTEDRDLVLPEDGLQTLARLWFAILLSLDIRDTVEPGAKGRASGGGQRALERFPRLLEYGLLGTQGRLGVTHSERDPVDLARSWLLAQVVSRPVTVHLKQPTVAGQLPTLVAVPATGIALGFWVAAVRVRAMLRG